MQAIANNEIHEVGYYGGGWIDTACGKRIHGKQGREYEIVFKQEVTCPSCKEVKLGWLSRKARRTLRSGLLQRKCDVMKKATSTW